MAMPRARGGSVVDHLAVDLEVAARLLLQSGDDAQKRGLAAARRAEQDHEFAVPDRQADAVDGVNLAECLLYVGRVLLHPSKHPNNTVDDARSSPPPTSADRPEPAAGCRSGGATSRLPFLEDLLGLLGRPFDRVFGRHGAGCGLGHHVADDEVVVDFVGRRPRPVQASRRRRSIHPRSAVSRACRRVRGRIVSSGSASAWARYWRRSACCSRCSP